MCAFFLISIQSNYFILISITVPRNKILLRKNKHLSSILLQILIMMWVFCIAFLVMNVFQSLLVTKLTLKKSKPVADTLSDLVFSKDCICLAPREMQIDHVIKVSWYFWCVIFSIIFSMDLLLYYLILFMLAVWHNLSTRIFKYCFTFAYFLICKKLHQAVTLFW